MKKLLSIVTFVLLVCSVVMVAAAVTPQAPPVTQLLTDRDLSTYDPNPPEIALAASGLHVAWAERGIMDANGGDMDMFYTTLPGSNTQRIRDVDAVTTGQGYTIINNYRLASGTNNQAYLAWVEPTATYGSDAFFWKTGMATPLNISDHALTTTGDATTLYLTVDDNNIPHVLWIERESSHYAVFYWQEGGNTTKISVVTPPVASTNITRALDLISKDGVTHAFWRDYSPTSTFDLYYWNTATQTAVNMRAGQPSPSNPLLSERAFVAPDGTFHAVWLELFASPLYKIAHWDSNSATHHTILSGDSAFNNTPVMANDGTLHVVNYVDGGPINHWTSQTLTNQQITATIGSGFPSTVAGKGNIPFYVAWRATDANYPGHMNDLFYWRPGMAQPQNITDHSQTPADTTHPGYLALAAADDGSVHIAWEEGAPTYYHSGSNTTTTLNNTWTVKYSTSGTDIRKSDTPYIGYQGVIFRVHNNIAYWFLAATATSTTTPYTMWRSDNNSYTPIPAVYGTDSPVGHGLRLLWFDRFGNPQVAWPTNVSGESSNLHYWNSSDGSVDLTDAQNTTGSVSSGAIGATDVSNNVYLVWMENNESPEFIDVFAAVKYPIFDNNLYIPLMQQ